MGNVAEKRSGEARETGTRSEGVTETAPVSVMDR